MSFFRWMAMIVTQLPLLLYVAGTQDLLFGFNQTSAGLFTLLALFAMAPLVDLFWLVGELARSFSATKSDMSAATFLMPLVAALFLVEAIAVDIYLLGQVRM